MRILTVLVFFSLAFADNTVSLQGAGATFPWPIYTDWIYAYSLVNTEASVNYTSAAYSVASDFLHNNATTIDFYSPNALLSRTDSVLQGKQDSVQIVPLTIGSLAIIYNIPGLAYEDGSTGLPQLVLATDVIADIYRGRITMWNDSRIAVDNPNVLLPEANITRVLRKDSSGYIYEIQSVLASFVDDWDFTPSLSWPTNITSLPRTSVVSSDFGLFSVVSTRNYSLTIVPYSQLVTQKIGLESPVALIKNGKGVVVSPDQPDVLAAQEGHSFDQYMMGNFVAPEYGYPFVLPSYVVYRTDIPQECPKLRELFKFIYWTKTSPEAANRANSLGFSAFNDANNKQITDFLLSAKCEGKLILETTVQTQHEGSAYPFFLSISLILLGISIILGAVWQYLNKSKCSKVVLMYQTILLIGITLTYVSVVFWYLVPDVNYICQCRIWFVTLGYSLILTAMFERTWQIKRVYGKVLKGSKLTTNVTGFLEVGGGIAIIISIQIVIMIVWTVTDPFQSELVTTDIYTFEGIYACSSKYGGGWLTVEAIYFGILLLWAIYVLYETWSIRTFIVESRWILIAMYNVLLFLALMSTLFATLHDLDDDLLVSIMVPFILLSTSTIVVAVYAPSVLKEFKLIVSTDSANSNNTSNKSKTEEFSKSRDVEDKHQSMPQYDIELQQ